MILEVMQEKKQTGQTYTHASDYAVQLIHRLQA